MIDFICPALEFLIFIPGLLAAYLPMKRHLRVRPRTLIVLAAVLTLFLCLAGGALCFFLSVGTLWLFFPASVCAGLFYIYTLEVTPWKSVSVFLAVCGSFSCLGNIANAIDKLLCPASSLPSLSLRAALFYNLMCWTATLLLWYPSAHSSRSLLEEDAFTQSWYVFWLLPALFIGLNLFLHPFPKLLQQKALIRMYVIIILSLLLLLLLFYGMFYLIAISLARNNRLLQENQFLAMQQARYESLCTAITETREARHDMRHHFHVLQGLAANQEWDGLTEYLTRASGRIPDAELHLCENTAADAVAAHYGLQFGKYNIPFSFRLDLPSKLPVPEIDLCLTLSNLLENALEASLKTDSAKRNIRVQAYLHSDCMVLLTVENAFDGKLNEKNGEYQSSKPRGGIGLQSVRHIAEKNGGYSRFLYENGTFCANVMLRPEK